ncbi:MAG: 30S ribosome-binding factor RbfA [Pseudomonadota bacterium]
MKAFSRIDRLSEEIKRQLAKLIQFEIKDPRLTFVSVMEVKLAKDLSFAKVYISSLADDTTIKQQLVVLKKAKGFLRKQLASVVKLRITPELYFVYDNSTREGNRISSLIDKAIAKDQLKSNHNDES